jgi:hypothetical protein
MCSEIAVHHQGAGHRQAEASRWHVLPSASNRPGSAMDDDGGQLIPVAGAPGGPSVRGGSCHGRPVCPQASPKRRGRDAFNRRRGPRVSDRVTMDTRRPFRARRGQRSADVDSQRLGSWCRDLADWVLHPRRWLNCPRGRGRSRPPPDRAPHGGPWQQSRRRGPPPSRTPCPSPHRTSSAGT